MKILDIAFKLNIRAYARVDTVKPEKLALLRAAGIRWLALGIESGSEHVRDGAEKALKSDDIIGIVRDIQKVGIFVIGNFIFGLPDDDEKSMRETLDLAKDLNCEFANFYCAMAYPGSPLYGVAKQKQWALPDDAGGPGWIGYSQHAYECLPLPTDSLTATQVLDFRDRAFLEYFGHPGYLAMVQRTFGPRIVAHVAEMCRHQVRRRHHDPAANLAA